MRVTRVLCSNAGLTRFRRVSWQVWIFAYTASQGPEITPSAGPECPFYPCPNLFLIVALTLTLSVMLTLILTVSLTQANSHPKLRLSIDVNLRDVMTSKLRNLDVIMERSGNC